MKLIVTVDHDAETIVIAHAEGEFSAHFTFSFDEDTEDEAQRCKTHMELRQIEATAIGDMAIFAALSRLVAKIGTDGDYFIANLFTNPELWGEIEV